MELIFVCALLVSPACAQTEADLLNAVRQHPHSPNALLALGAFYNQTGQFEKAEPWLRQAVAASPKMAAARLEWASALARLHRFSDAAAALDGVRPPEDTPRRIAYYRLRAAVDAGNGDLAGAAGAMSDAVRLSPGNARLALAAAAAQAGFGDDAEKHGQSVEAARAYQKAVELAPANEDYRLALAIELLRHQTFEPALLVLEEGVKRFPDSPRMRTALGLAYFLVDRNSDAVKSLLIPASYEPALRYLGEIELSQTATPDPEAVTRLCAHAGFGAVCGGLLLRQAMDAGDQRNRDEIFRKLKDAALAAPEDATARCQLGKAYEWASAWNEARAELEACARIDPDSAEAHYRLARVYRQLGERELAARESKLRDEAERRQGEANERRYANLTQFLYTLGK